MEMNKVCKSCGRKYHFCNGCGYDGIDRNNFCSEYCERMYVQGPKIVEGIETLLNALNDKEKEILANILYPNKIINCEIDHDFADIEYGDSPFDEDMIKGVLRDVFKDHLSLVMWGYW